jgi:hypothetical protein
MVMCMVYAAAGLAAAGFLVAIRLEAEAVQSAA